MQAASLLDGFSFDLFPPFENGPAAPEVDVSRRQVVQALVVSTVGVVADELLDALFELSWQVVVVQQDPVFHRAMISLDLALRHRVIRPAADMSDAVVLEPLAKLARHVGWTVIDPMTQGKIERYHRSMKNRILLDNYYLPGQLEQSIEEFVSYYNNCRYHESLDNLTPADVYFGRGQVILERREKIKRKTIEQRRRLHQQAIAA